MSNPLETKNGLRYFLKFYDFNMDWYEIPEPVGMDAAKFVKKQEEKKWNRSVEYFAIDGLQFPNAYGIKIITPRAINPRGDNFDHMDYGLQWLLAARKKKGFEMKVEFKVTKFDVDFRVFELDTRDEDLTDGKNYFKCKLIDIGLVADHKRNLENTFDAFSDKNVDDETITPIDSFNYLVKATPLKKQSIFKLSGDYSHSHSGITDPTTATNPSQVIIKSEINDTLGWLQPEIFIPNDNPSLFGLIRAAVTTTNITVEVDFDLEFQALNQGVRVDLFVYREGDTGTVVPLITAMSGRLIQKKIYHFDDLEVGRRIFCFFRFTGGSVDFIFRKNTITVDVVETELDIVTTAVRYTDWIKQAAKWVNNLPVVFSKIFDVNGYCYDQAIFNRAMISNRKELTATPKTIYESVDEVCGDVEISREKIFVGQDVDFYENKEIGAFLILPSDDYTEPFNKRHGINKFAFGYKNFEKEKTVAGTSKGIHTESEWIPNNKHRNDDKEIKIDLVRDPFDKQEMVNLEIKRPTTATDKDTKAYIEDMVRIAPNTSREFVRTLLMRWENGFLEILNRNTIATNEDAILNWNSIGTGVGSSFEILSGANIGVYTIVEIKEEGTIIRLQPTSTIPQQTGNFTIRIKHYFTNVLWQTRTNEGFIIAPEGFSNLRFSIKRNMKFWYYYLAAVLMYCKKDMKNSKFLNNGDSETRLTTETASVIEKSTVLYSELPNPLVEPIIINETIVAPFDDVLAYLERYENEKGFIRLWDLQGNVKRVFSQKFEYLLVSEKADIIGEKKYEDEYLRIDVIGDDVNVNDAPYNLQGTSNWYKTENDEIQLYDEKSRPLSNFYSYEFVLLNGQKFNSIAELVTALSFYKWT